ncbi:MAG: ATP-binding protein [Zymomonas mobilis]
MMEDSAIESTEKTEVDRKKIRLWPLSKRKLYYFLYRCFPAWAETLTFVACLVIAFFSYRLTVYHGTPAKPLSPLVIALLLVANLVPAMMLMVLLARRLALRRAAKSPLGGRGRLHVRLVAIFSIVAAVPTLLVVIFASLLFQYGVSFWFSDSARTILANADRVAQSYVKENTDRIIGDLNAMPNDFRAALSQAPIEDPRWSRFIFMQLINRGLNEVALLQMPPSDTGAPIMLAGALTDTRPLENRLPAKMIALLRDKQAHTSISSGDRIEAAILLDAHSRLYIYISRQLDPVVLLQASRAKTALGDYNRLVESSRVLQIRFNGALLVVSLLIVAIAIYIAFVVADRIVRPISHMVEAVRRIGSGDLGARTHLKHNRDEIGTLGFAFNRMANKLEEQTNTLMSVNYLLDSRRAFTEAVLSGVSAGVLSVNSQHTIQLVNLSAQKLLKADEKILIGEKLDNIAPELDSLLAQQAGDSIVHILVDNEPRTFAVRVVRAADNHVLTFDDITQQLADQRSAAWADVARRIAHEIKNPLTPIQLAAERLQRRYGRQITSDEETFSRLTSTIVRQVGDLRRMVDEFSSFARMPKPVFRKEAISDIGRHALFLHEVAHPQIGFVFEAQEDLPLMVCDQRQLGRALTNLVKNAVEAIEENDRGGSGHVWMTLKREDSHLIIEVADDGIGLPKERERLTEPYMTTRVRGTGLGLAIVKKIVEEHAGTLTFSDREGGGTIVRLSFDLVALAPVTIESVAEKGIGNQEPAIPGLTRSRSE